MADAVDMSAQGTVLSPDSGQHPSDLQRAFEAVYKKKPVYDTDFAYYDGDQPVVYATDMLSAYFRTLNARFVENWCAPVVDAVLERLTLKGFDVADGNQAAKEMLNDLMQGGGLELEAYDVQTAAIVTGEGSIIVWPSDEDPGTIDLYANDPRQVAVFYDEERPKRIAFAGKLWRNLTSGITYLNLYYDDRVEHYRTRTDKKPTEWREFVPLPEEEGAPVELHEFGRVPVFHFRRNRRRLSGELRGKVMPQQDMVNKLLADMMVSSEFAGFKQRYAISNADLSDLEADATTLWTVPPGAEGEQPTQVGQFEATDLQNFLFARTALAEGIAIISHTPKHYMTGATQPSGEALIAMDAPLTKKVAHYQELFAATWRDLAIFYCQLNNIALEAKDVTVIWEPANIEQPETTSNVVKNLNAAGMPLTTALREYDGWEPNQLERMAEDEKEAAKNAPPSLGEIALKAAGQRLNGAPAPVAGVSAPAPFPPAPAAAAQG